MAGTPGDPTLSSLSRRADVLVHKAMLATAVDRMIADVPNAPDLKRSMLSHHTTAEDAGRVAQAAGVGTLVLSHPSYRQTIRVFRRRPGSRRRAAIFVDA